VIDLMSIRGVREEIRALLRCERARMRPAWAPRRGRPAICHRARVIVKWKWKGRREEEEGYRYIYSDRSQTEISSLREN
jgi:hypothetical protein